MSPAPFSDQGRKSQAEVTTSPELDKDACSLEAPATSGILAGVALCQAAPLPVCHTGFLISTWTLDRDQYCRHRGKEGLLMRIFTHLGEPPVDRKDRLKAPAESRPVCFAQNQEAALQWIPLHQKTLCSQPCDPRGCQVRAVSQCLSVMKGFNHTAWPERAHAELGNGPLLPWPPDTAAQRWHCSARS